jgi:3-hydroxyisobutyrate dehydrogenase-like beta-hydroxyacid dehydrogenase
VAAIVCIILLSVDPEVLLSVETSTKLGWIGAGRMGTVLVERLLRSGFDLAVYNRTLAKTTPLQDLGATVAEAPSQLVDRDVVFTMIGGDADLLAVTGGPVGLLSGPRGPGLLIDCSTVSSDVSGQVRRRAEEIGTAMLAAPVSGNPKVARAGMLSVVASGPKESFDLARPLLELLGRSVTYVGEGDGARLVKIAHNAALGVVTQCLADHGPRRTWGSRSLGPVGLHQRLGHGLNVHAVQDARLREPRLPSVVHRAPPQRPGASASKRADLDVPLPVTAVVHEIVTDLVRDGHGDEDFAALLLLEAARARPERSQKGWSSMTIATGRRSRTSRAQEP